VNSYLCTLCNTYITNNQEEHLKTHQDVLYNYVQDAIILDVE
jgi:hypothetical protein